MKQINLRVDPEFLERIDRARASVPRERWIRHLIEDALEAGERPLGLPALAEIGAKVKKATNPKKKPVDPVNAPVGLGPTPDHAFKPRPTNPLKCFVCGQGAH